MSAPALLFLVLLLVAPVLALHQLTAVVNGWLLGSGALALSVVTYGMYALDKRRAQAGAWRVPELWLHVAAAAGGWPAAWIAQQRLRHKNRKVSFQITFWLFVALHQFLAVDFVRDWTIVRSLVP